MTRRWYGVGASIAAAVLALASAPAGSAAVGVFRSGATDRADNPTGVSVFTETGTSLRARGGVVGLKSKVSVFTVVYGPDTAAGDCDPAVAFPFGPFKTDKQGTVSYDLTLPNPMGVDLANTGSVSIRMADTNADLDGDGIKGRSDVVAVAGTPSVGLIACQGAPLRN